MAFQGLSSTITFMKNNADAIFYRAFQRHCPILHINKADTGADICYMSMVQKDCWQLSNQNSKLSIYPLGISYF